MAKMTIAVLTVLCCMMSSCIAEHLICCDGANKLLGIMEEYSNNDLADLLELAEEGDKQSVLRKLSADAKKLTAKVKSVRCKGENQSNAKTLVDTIRDQFRHLDDDSFNLNVPHALFDLADDSLEYAKQGKMFRRYHDQLLGVARKFGIEIKEFDFVMPSEAHGECKREKRVEGGHLSEDEELEKRSGRRGQQYGSDDESDDDRRRGESPVRHVSERRRGEVARKASASARGSSRRSQYLSDSD